MTTSVQTRIPKTARNLVTASVTDMGNIVCQCEICGQGWQVAATGWKPLHRGWWKCSNGCTQRALDEQKQE